MIFGKIEIKVNEQRKGVNMQSINPAVLVVVVVVVVVVVATAMSDPS